MSKEKITALIDKVIGKNGPLRIPAYWMREVLNSILSLTSNIEMSVSRLDAKTDTKIEDTRNSIPTKVSQLENDADFVTPSYVDTKITESISENNEFLNSRISAVETRLVRNEQVTAAALNDLNDRMETLVSKDYVDSQISQSITTTLNAEV